MASIFQRWFSCLKDFLFPFFLFFLPSLETLWSHSAGFGGGMEIGSWRESFIQGQPDLFAAKMLWCWRLFSELRAYSCFCWVFQQTQPLVPRIHTRIIQCPRNAFIHRNSPSVLAVCSTLGCRITEMVNLSVLPESTSPIPLCTLCMGPSSCYPLSSCYPPSLGQRHPSLWRAGVHTAFFFLFLGLVCFF